MKGQVQFLITFLTVFLVHKLCTSGLYIIAYFENGQCFIWGFLVFSFLVFNVYKNLISNHHLLFLAIIPDLDMLQFSSVNYICQVCKSYLCFEHVQNCEQCLSLSVFSKQWKCPAYSFCQIYVVVQSLYSKLYFFCTFWRLKTLVLFCFLYLCIYFVQKRIRKT